MKRSTLRVAAGLLGAVLLSSCGAGVLTSGSGAGVAAKVGETTITTGDLTELVNRGLENEQFKQSVGDNKDDYQRRVLTQLITRALDDQAAAKLGVTVTDADVEKRYQEFVTQAGGAQQLEEQAATNGIAKDDIRTIIRDFVVSDAISDKLVADVKITDAQIKARYDKDKLTYDRVRLQHVLVKEEALAKSLLAQLRGGADFAAIVKQHSTDEGSKANGGIYDFAPRGQYVKPFEDAAFSTPPGQLVGPVKTEFGFHVIKVLERKITTLAQATAEIRTKLQDEAKQTKLPEYLTQLAKDLGVTVNPRFGDWDPAAREVVAPKDEVSTTETAPPAVEAPEQPEQSPATS